MTGRVRTGGSVRQRVACVDSVDTRTTGRYAASLMLAMAMAMAAAEPVEGNMPNCQTAWLGVGEREEARLHVFTDLSRKHPYANTDRGIVVALRSPFRRQNALRYGHLITL